MTAPTIIGNATLYTFSALSGKHVKVVRLTAARPDDWHAWPDQYRQDHPNLDDLLEIAAIEVVDEREPNHPSTRHLIANSL